jgi:hypothetical protein
MHHPSVVGSRTRYMRRCAPHKIPNLVDGSINNVRIEKRYSIHILIVTHSHCGIQFFLYKFGPLIKKDLVGKFKRNRERREEKREEMTSIRKAGTTLSLSLPMMARKASLLMLLMALTAMMSSTNVAFAFILRSPSSSSSSHSHSHSQQRSLSSSSLARIFSSRGGFDDEDEDNRVKKKKSNNNKSYTFQAMTRFDDRLSLLEVEAAPDFLNDYYESDIRSFSISPGSIPTTDTESGEKKKKKLSVSSTVYGLRALTEYPTSSLARTIIGSTQGSSSLREQIKALIHSDWREDDLYDISLLLSIIFKLDPTLVVVNSLLLNDNDKETTKSKFSILLKRILSGRPRRRRGEEQQFSAYINYLCATVYVDLANAINFNSNGNNLLQLGAINDVQIKELFANDDNNDESDESESIESSSESESSYAEFFFKEITIAVSRSAETAKDELCRQLAYQYSGDKSNFDVIKLVYNLLSYIKATNSLKGITTIMPSMANNSAATIESIPKINNKLVSSALEVFFKEQDDNQGQADGLWDRGQPIYKSFKKKGRNVGNAYVFGIDALGSLLDVFGGGSNNNDGNDNSEIFRPYLPNLERALDWIEFNKDIDTTVIIADKQCNPETGRCYGRPLRGWCSPHLSPSSGPNAWSTAQTITCMARMRRIVKQLLHNDVLREFNGISINKNNAGWDRLLDSDLGCGDNNVRTIKSVLDERVITPFDDVSDVRNPDVGAAYSTILFGSPGTAKTTICEAVAEKLGWDFLVIDTSVFLADGLTNVASRIQYVFKRLQSLRRCVILFDEIEEFCLNRDNVNLSMESRMLTTAMLTAINDLRRTKQSIFFIATNRLRAFDAAIIRPG